jgi:hypothetical protein
MIESEPKRKISKRSRQGEGHPSKRTPEIVAKIAAAIVSGLTDEEASLLAGINPDTMTEWRKDPEFSGAIKRATAERLLLRLERIGAGEQGWQGTAWALERIYISSVCETRSHEPSEHLTLETWTAGGGPPLTNGGVATDLIQVGW